MKSASNGSIVESRLQVLHVHVLLVAPLGAGNIVQPDTDQHKSSVSIRKGPHHTGVAAYLPV